MSKEPFNFAEYLVVVVLSADSQEQLFLYICF